MNLLLCFSPLRARTYSVDINPFDHLRHKFYASWKVATTTLLYANSTVGGILPSEFLPVGISSVEYLPAGFLPIWNFTHWNVARRKLGHWKSARGNLPVGILPAGIIQIGNLPVGILPPNS